MIHRLVRLFIVAILIGTVLSLFKVIGVKKKDIIEVKNQKS
jgi:hypothetical protein